MLNFGTWLLCKYRVQLSSHWEPPGPKQSTWAMQVPLWDWYGPRVVLLSEL